MKRWLGTLAILAALQGCASTCETLFPKRCATPEPIVNYVPITVPREPLPLPAEPERAHLAVDPEDWRAWLSAFASDYLSQRAWALRMRHIIESSNAAEAELSR